MKALRHNKTGLIIPDDVDLPVHKDPARDWVVDAQFIVYDVDPKDWQALDIPAPARVRRPHDMTLSEQKTWRRYAQRYGPLAAATALPKTTTGFDLIHRCFHLLCPPITPLRELRRFTELTGLELEQDYFATNVTGVWTLDRFKFIERVARTHPAALTAVHLHAWLVREYDEEAANLMVTLFDYTPDYDRTLRRGIPRAHMKVQLLEALRGARPLRLDMEQMASDMMNIYGQALELLDPGTLSTLLSKAGGRKGV